MRVHGYTMLKLLHSTAAAQVYEGVSETDRTEVVLKRYLAEGDDQSGSRASREFDALRRIVSPGVPRAVELAASEDWRVLVLERMPGIPLSRILDAKPITIGAWLDLAIELADALIGVHEARVLHKDLSPAHVLLDVRTGRASIIGFRLATDLGAAEPIGRLERGAGISLVYIAPEQTGRMNRGCDARSDLYSLGATLYHALTGRPPFLSRDPLELVHCHIARVPENPSDLRREVPEALSELVLKLLRKQPEERYQSAQGLRFDLAACREQWTQSGDIDASVALGAADAPDKPRFSMTLHGRERETGVLTAAYERARRGRLECVVIRGEAGSGKTALVDHLRMQLVRSSGYLASGKFDPGHDRPYGGWVSVLESLAQQVLVQSNESLARWQRELRSGVGSIARALVDHVPDLALILGETEPVPALGPRETQARLSLALQRMLQVCARPEHPVVLFLDDLQWSDAGSRSLLQDLLSSSLSPALLIVLAQRDGRSASDAVLASISQRELEVVRLGPLPTDALVRMLTETLHRTPQEVLPLAKWIEGATGGSPLMIRQLIEHLHDRGLLRYEIPVGWRWDTAEIASMPMPDNAIALLAAKIDRLEPSTRTVLQLASCMGDEFDREILAELSRMPRGGLERELYVLCDASLIAPSSRGFRFLYDRIREAVQSQLSDRERSRLHYEVGHRLLLQVPEQERAERVFEIVEQLDRGLEHVSEDLRWQVIELNVLAGKRALGAGAAATGDRYLTVARQLLREEDSTRERQVVLGLHLDSAESAFQIGEYERALALLDELERQPLEPLERARIRGKRVRVFSLTKHPEDCTRYALAVLRELGVGWPLHPSRLRVWAAIAVAEWTLRGDRGRRLRPSTKISTRWISQLVMLNPSGGAMSRSDARLPLLASCLVLRCAGRHGYLASPALTLAGYALFSYPWVRSRKRALRHTRLALEWLEREPDVSRGLRAELEVHALLHPWLMPRRQAFAPVERVAERAQELGDREYAYYAHLNSYSPLALAGDPVHLSEQRFRIVAESARRASLLCPDEGERMHAVYRLLLVELSDAALEAHVAETDEWIATHSSSADPFIRTLLMLVLCVHGRHDLAFAQSEALGERLFRIVPFVHVADHTFLRGLAAAALAGDVRVRRRSRWVRVVRRSARLLERWARRGSSDFAHMVLALEAERARLRGKAERARTLYQRAVQQARKQRFPHHAALIHERRASHLRALRRDSESVAALAEAEALYREWGALPKANALAATRAPRGPRPAGDTGGSAMA
jgi:tetratricopeptide (TPR) repeat protein